MGHHPTNKPQSLSGPGQIPDSELLLEPKDGLRNPGRTVLSNLYTWEESMPAIRVKENEPFEVAIRRFKRTVEKTGLLTELRAREFYEKPTAERKRKLAAAVKRHHKRMRSQTLPPKLY